MPRPSQRICLQMLSLLILAVACSTTFAAQPIRAPFCAKNQVVKKLTVYEDGALEAECGPIPCGEAGRRCIEDQTSCRADTDVFSGMRWAPNGESILMRCCTLKAANKIYVGTDIVSSGSFYEGGPVAQKDLYGTSGGSEYDFIANARTEQGGVRVWVYRMICNPGEQAVDFDPITTPIPLAPLVATTPATTTLPPVAVDEEPQQPQEEPSDDAENAEEEEVDENEEEEVGEEPTTTAESRVFNPLRYRPPHVPRSTGVRRA